MPKVTRRLGQDRVAPERIGGVRAPTYIPTPEHNLSLDALLERTVQQEQATSPVMGAEILQSIAVDLIDPSPYQPRLSISEGQLEELADSIQSTGLLHPILVRPQQGRYELIGGERRWRAHQLLKRSHILARVCVMDDAAAEISALADNEGQASLTDYERGKRFHEILSKGLESSQRALARRISVNVSTISRCLSFMSLPPVALAVLNEAPGLIGAKNIRDFVAFGEQQPEALKVALLKMKDEGLSQEAALRWLQRQNDSLRGQTRRLTNEKRSVPGIGQLHMTGHKIQLHCERHTDPTRLIELLEQFLATVPADRYQKQQ